MTHTATREAEVDPPAPTTGRCRLRRGAERRTRRQSADDAPPGLAPVSASRSKPARILGLKENAAADGIRRFAAVCMSARCGWSVGAGPRRWWSAARRCALREHGPRKAMRSATTTMLRLAALHLPSPFYFQGRRLATLMRFGAMSGLRVGYFWREWRKRYLLICTNEASLKRAAV